MEELSCKNCGGMLDSNLKCPYCGTQYKADDPTHVTTNNNTSNTYNITLNVGAGADTSLIGNILSGALPQQEQPTEEEQPEVVEPEPAPESEPEPEPEEPKPMTHYERHPTLTRLASSAGLLFAVSIISCPVCLYFGFQNENTTLMLIGIGAGILTGLISTFWKEK